MFDLERYTIPAEEGVFGSLFKKKADTTKKDSNTSSQQFSGKFTRIDITSANKGLFDKLYNNEALTAEGMKVEEGSLESVNEWFRETSKCRATDIDIYIIKGKIMNDYYHLTGDNRYPNDSTIVAIDWVSANVHSPYKGKWRWFSDVCDNNARREIEKKNPYYKHYQSVYYGDMGYESDAIAE